MSKSGRIHQTEKARLLTVSCPNNSMYKRNLVLKKRLLSLSSSRIYGLKKVIANSKLGVSQSVHKISRCILPLRCTLPLHCFLQLLSRSVHREKCSNLSTIHWFHSACTSVSTFAISAEKCLFLCSCFSPSLCVHIGFAIRLYRGCNPFTRSIMGFVCLHLKIGVWEQWSVENQSCKLAMLL